MPGSTVVRDLQEKMLLCRDRNFTGVVKVSAQQDDWLLYFVLGEIVWLRPRKHELRRWQRQLSIHSPGFFKYVALPAHLSYKSWNYTALAELVKARRFSAEQFDRVVEGTIAEGLFELLQAGVQQQQKTGRMLAYRSEAKQIRYVPKDLTGHEQAWQSAQQLWLEWEQAGLAHISPDWAPSVSNLEELRSRTSPQTFQTLTKFMDGSNTLRDLAFKFNRPSVNLTKAVLPYISKDLLAFAELPDLVEDFYHAFYPTLFVEELNILDLPSREPATRRRNVGQSVKPIPSTVTTPNAVAATGVARSDRFNNQNKVRSSVENTAPKVVYIDDSPLDDRAMSAVVKSLGYRYSSISNPIHALPTLLETKPDFIFLDLVMPIANGYEVCSQIRRISSFKHTPIVIVTSNDGIGDRVRAKFVGASGFLGKPIREKKVSKMLKKFLPDVEPAIPVHQTNPRNDHRTGGILYSP